jgi:hypothetical protein
MQFDPSRTKINLDWLIVAIYIRGQYPDWRLVRTQGRNVVALRKYLQQSSKSDKLGAPTLAKIPFVNQDKVASVLKSPPCGRSQVLKF